MDAAKYSLACANHKRLKWDGEQFVPTDDSSEIARRK
jgi:hypothetical protein